MKYWTMAFNVDCSLMDASLCDCAYQKELDKPMDYNDLLDVLNVVKGNPELLYLQLGVGKVSL